MYSMLSSRIRKLIGLIGAIIVFILGVLVLTLSESFDEPWYVGLIFVIIAIVYFIVAVYLKTRKRQ